MDIIERAARAICCPTGCINEQLGSQCHGKQAYEEYVRDMLMAMREPDEGMIEAASAVPCDEPATGGVVYSTATEATAIWQAMIDQALKG